MIYCRYYLILNPVTKSTVWPLRIDVILNLALKAEFRTKMSVLYQ
jgi:hypothetical protein